MAIFTPVDDLRLVYRFRLSELNWTDEQWQKLMLENPYAGAPGNYRISDKIRRIQSQLGMNATEHFHARADWLLRVAMHPGRYEHLLLRVEDEWGRSYQIQTQEQLEAHLGVDYELALSRSDRNYIVRSGRTADHSPVSMPDGGQASEHDSGVSRAARIIERVQIPNGYYWISYDFDREASADDGDVTLGLTAVPYQPLNKNIIDAYVAVTGEQYSEEHLSLSPQFNHDGGEMIFSLPNGLQGYWVTTAEGDPLSAAPEKIVSVDFFGPEGLDLWKRLPLRTWEYSGVKLFDPALTPTVGLSSIGFGASCSSCHAGEGVFGHSSDAVRPFFTSQDTLFGSSTRERPNPLEQRIISEIYISESEMDTIFANDRDDYLRAVLESYRAIGLTPESEGWPILISAIGVPQKIEREYLNGDNPVVGVTSDYANSFTHYFLREPDDFGFTVYEILELELGLSTAELISGLEIDVVEETETLIQEGFPIRDIGDILVELKVSEENNIRVSSGEDELSRREKRQIEEDILSELALSSINIRVRSRPSRDMQRRIDDLRRSRILQILSAELWLTPDSLAREFDQNDDLAIRSLERAVNSLQLHRELGSGFGSGQNSFECEFPNILQALGWENANTAGLYNALGTGRSICDPSADPINPSSVDTVSELDRAYQEASSANTCQEWDNFLASYANTVYSQDATDAQALACEREQTAQEREDADKCISSGQREPCEAYRDKYDDSAPSYAKILDLIEAWNQPPEISLLFSGTLTLTAGEPPFKVASISYLEGASVEVQPSNRLRRIGDDIYFQTPSEVSASIDLSNYTITVTNTYGNSTAEVIAVVVKVGCESGYLAGDQCLDDYDAAARYLQTYMNGLGCSLPVDGDFGPNSVRTLKHLTGIEIQRYSAELTPKNFVNIVSQLRRSGELSNCGCEDGLVYNKNTGSCEDPPPPCPSGRVCVGVVGTYLTGEQLRQLVSGNTVVFGPVEREYHYSSGSTIYRNSDGDYRFDGEWWISNRKISYHYSGTNSGCKDQSYYVSSPGTYTTSGSCSTDGVYVLRGRRGI